MGFLQPSPEILWFYFYKTNVLFPIATIVAVLTCLLIPNGKRRMAIPALVFGGVGVVVLTLPAFVPNLALWVQPLSPIFTYYHGALWVAATYFALTPAIGFARRWKIGLQFMNTFNIFGYLSLWWIAF